MQQNYKSKYIKYKSKYAQLKNKMTGGTREVTDTDTYITLINPEYKETVYADGQRIKDITRTIFSSGVISALHGEKLPPVETENMMISSDEQARNEYKLGHAYGTELKKNYANDRSNTQIEMGASQYDYITKIYTFPLKLGRYQPVYYLFALSYTKLDQATIKSLKETFIK